MGRLTKDDRGYAGMFFLNSIYDTGYIECLPVNPII